MSRRRAESVTWQQPRGRGPALTWSRRRFSGRRLATSGVQDAQHVAGPAHAEQLALALRRQRFGLELVYDLPSGARKSLKNLSTPAAISVRYSSVGAGTEPSAFSVWNASSSRIV